MRGLIRKLVLSAGIVVLLAPAASAGSEAEARRYEHMKLKAAALRQEAEHLRSKAAAENKLDSVRGQAKALDQQADALEEKARDLEPADWPPAE